MVVRAVALSILGFFSAALSAQSESEPNDDQAGADLLPASTATTGNIGCGNNTEDWFAITTVDDGRLDLSVDVSNTGVPGSLQVQVFNSGGGLLANVQVTSGTPIVLEHPCYSAGLYYLRFFRNSADCYSYSIAWNLAEPVYDNDTEPNNSTAAADADPQVDPGTSINGHVNFYHYGDNSDYYRIESPDQGRITFTLIAETAGADDASGGQLQLFNSGGGLLENWSVAVGGYASPDTTTLTTYCKGAGTYYVRFYANSSCGVSYRLRFDGSAPVYANDMESNDNIAQASAVAYNTFTEGRLSFYYDDNDDWYAIDPPDQGIIQLEVSAENVGPADGSGLQVQFFNEGGGLLDNWSVAVGGGTGTATTVVSTSCKGTGTYYVRIFANTPCGVSYVWRYSGSAPFYLNDTESNDNLTDADPVEYDSPQQGRVAFYYEDNDDWYRIDPPDQGIIHIEVMAENAGSADAAGLQVQFFNDGGGLLENWSVGVGGDVEPVNSVVSTICKGTGVYYVRFFANTPCGVSYQWSYNGSAPVYANDTESNDNPTEAVPVSYDDPMEGRLAFYYDDNSDYYRIDPPDQGIIHIEVMAESVGDPDGAGMQVQFYNEGGGLLDNWSVPVGGGLLPDTTVVSTTCKGTGIYYVRFFANAPCGVSYKWRYSGSAPVYANDPENNDNPTEAVPVSYEDPMEGRLAFYYDDNSDYYRIDPPDQGIIHIEVMAESVGNPDGAGMQVQFYNEGGGLLDNWSVPVGGGLLPDTTVVSTTCKGTGIYYVRFFANAPCGVSYKWRYSGTAPVFANDAEQNDNSSQADTIPFNSPTEGRSAFYYDDNEDWFAITPVDASIIHFTISAEHVGDTDPSGLQVQFFNDGGGLLENWSIAVGGSSLPATTTINTYCRGAGTYYLRLYANSPCGISYSWECTATVPAFGADAEPNNTTAQATPISLANWWQDGRLDFYYGDNDDWYGFAIGAEENVSVSTSAENPGEEGTMQVQLFNSGGGLLGNLSVDVGGNGVPVQDVADFGLFPAGGYFLRVYSNSTCGVSYRLLCYDADGDGICDGTALGTAAVIAPLVPISARPNPSADGSFILTAAFTPAWMEVRDMNGQLLLLERMPTVREWRLDLSQRPAGVYSVRVVDTEGHATTTRLVRF